MWSLKYKHCVICGTTSRRHLGRGLCEKCYQRDIEKNHRPSSNNDRTAATILTKEFLITEYLQEQKSLSDICVLTSCSRQYVYKKIKEYGIALRSKEESRKLALEKGKVSFEKIDENGNASEVILQKNKYNDKFFQTWSNSMAYVLGVIYTDGNIRPGIYNNPTTSDTLGVGRLTIAQKEPELLHKTLTLMESDAKLLFRKRKTHKTGISGEIYFFHINNNSIYDDLIKLGLTPNKSLTMKFPDVPVQYLRHFIRGCWDGDGSVYIEKKRNCICTSFVSGSYTFIETMLSHFYSIGLSKRTIHNDKSGKSFYFKYTGKDCETLYHFFYDDVPEEQYLSRKYLVFKNSIHHIEAVCRAGDNQPNLI